MPALRSVGYGAFSTISRTAASPVGHHPMAFAPRPPYGHAMANINFLPAGKVGPIIGTVLFVALTACVKNESNQRRGYRGSPVVQAQATVVIQDDYDYYPGYETYYSRNRHEYVYRDGNAWVRRPEPRGVTANVLLAAPSVRLDFHDSPEQHHSSVVRSYPKNWTPPGKDHGAKDDRNSDKKDEKKPDNGRN